MKIKILLILSGAVLLMGYNNCGQPTTFSSAEDSKVHAMKSDSLESDNLANDANEDGINDGDNSNIGDDPAVDIGENEHDEDLDNPENEVVPACPRKVRPGKVCICHIPPGNPSARHTIVVSESALQTHLIRHRDLPGGCEAQ